MKEPKPKTPYAQAKLDFSAGRMVVVDGQFGRAPARGFTLKKGIPMVETLAGWQVAVECKFTAFDSLKDAQQYLND